MLYTHPTLHLWVLSTQLSLCLDCPGILHILNMGQTDLVRYILPVSWLMNTSRKGPETLVR